MKRIGWFLLLYLMILFFYPWSVQASQPVVEAPVAVLMDADSGQILYEKASQEQSYPASITKILTALLFVENADMNESITVGETVPSQIEVGSSQIYLLPGEVLTGEQLLNALLVESANDAAVVIAEHVSGSVEAFAALMNQRARALGATHSNFVNPHGLHDENHYTTAEDMALILKEVIKRPELREVMVRRNYVIPATQHQETRYLWTRNDLYQSKSGAYYNENVIAGKTGYTNQAGNTLVSAAQKDGMTFIVVVLRCNGPMTYASTNTLYQYAFDQHSLLKLLDKDQVVKTIELGRKTLDLVAAQSFQASLPPSQHSSVEQVVELKEEVSYPLSKGDPMGTVVYLLGDREIGRIGLLAASAMKAPFSLGVFMRNLLVGIALFLVTAYLVLRVYVASVNRKIRKKKLAKKRRGEYAKF